MYHGGADHHFDVTKTFKNYRKLFKMIGVNKDAIKDTVIAPNLGHDYSPAGSKAFIKFAEGTKL